MPIILRTAAVEKEKKARVWREKRLAKKEEQFDSMLKQSWTKEPEPRDWHQQRDQVRRERLQYQEQAAEQDRAADAAQEIVERKRAELRQAQNALRDEKLRIAAREREIAEEVSEIQAKVFKNVDFNKVRYEQAVGQTLRDLGYSSDDITAGSVGALADSLVTEGVDIADDGRIASKQAIRLQQAAATLKKIGGAPLGIYSNAVMIADMWKNTHHGSAAALEVDLAAGASP